jgi:hypothetical protein
VVDTAATYAIERALTHQPGQNNLTWGEFARRSIDRVPLGEIINEELETEELEKVDKLKS